MYKDYLAMAAIAAISVLLLLIFVKKSQIKTAFFAFLLAQLFSWPITILYVQFGLQENPVRLFPHATESNFLFSFIFHPSVFAVYYLHYPKMATTGRRTLYSAVFVALPIIFQFLTSLYTNLIYHPYKLVTIGSYVLLFIVYSVSRIYMDWYFSKYHWQGWAQS